MLEVTALRVRSLSMDYLNVSWRLKDTLEDVYDYTMEVQRSESAYGPWDTITVPFRDRYAFQDRDVPYRNPLRALFYRIRVTHTPSGEVSFSEVADTQAPVDLIVKEVRRHMGLLLQEFAGRRCWLLPVRTFGQRCGTCWNPVLFKKTRSGCVECYDTGFKRGFMAPIELFVQIDPSQNAKQPGSIGVMSQSDTTARCVDVDGIKSDDVIIEAENRRWRVMSVTQTEHGRAAIHSELLLHEIQKGDVEYKYELPVSVESLRDLALSPARNFTNPSNLSTGVDEALPQTFALYNLSRTTRTS